MTEPERNDAPLIRATSDAAPDTANAVPRYAWVVVVVVAVTLTIASGARFCGCIITSLI